MTHVSNLIFMLISIVPGSLVIYRLFREHMKPFWHCLLSFCVTMVFLVCSEFVFMHVFSSALYFQYSFSFFSYVLLSLLLWYMSDFHFVESLYLIYFSSNFADITHLVSHFMVDVRFASFAFLDSISIPMLLSSCVIIPVMYLFYKYKIKPLLNISMGHIVWRHMWLMPVLFFVLYRLTIYPHYLAESSSFYRAQWIIPICWSLGVLMVQYTSLSTISYFLVSKRLEEKLHYTQLLYKTQISRYKRLRANLQMDHDMRQNFREFILEIQTLAKQKNAPEINARLEHHLGKLEGPLDTVFCENTHLNTLLSYYYVHAQKEQILFTISASVPNDLLISPNDLCVLVGNLTENALEACQRQTGQDRHISLQIQMQGPGLLALSIKNTYEGTIQEDQKGFHSSKRDAYGIGTASVQSIVTKYKGVLTRQYDTLEFQVYALLNNIEGS